MIHFIKVFFFLMFLFFSMSIFSQNLETDLKLEDENSNESKQEIVKNHIKTEPQFYQFFGNIRNLLFGTKSQTSEFSSRIFLLENLKLNLGGTLNINSFEAQIQLDNEFSFSNQMQNKEFNYYKPISPRNRLIPNLYQYEGQDYTYKTALKKGYVKYHNEQLQMTAGRQMISWGEGRFLNPLDLITPVNPFSFDLDDIEGADSLNAHLFFNDADSLQLVFVPYLRENNKNLNSLKIEDSNYLIRPKLTFENLDTSFVAGRHFHSFVFGIEFNITVWSASFRMSYLARKEDSFTDRITQPGNTTQISEKWVHQAVIGSSYAFFNGKLKTTLEFFLNSGNYENNNFLQTALLNERNISAGMLAPSTQDTTFFCTSGRVLTKNPILGELGLSYQLTDLMTLDLFSIYDPIGNSAYFHPGISISLSDESTLNMGANFYFYSKRNESHAEFGGSKTAVYGFIKWHF